MRVLFPGKRLQAIVLLAATVLISGSQCARVGDSTVGPQTLAEAREQGIQNCVKDCQNAAREARDAEQSRFQEAQKNCTSGDCHREEATRHQAVIDRINTDEAACEAGCHEQGSGRGGQ